MTDLVRSGEEPVISLDRIMPLDEGGEQRMREETEICLAMIRYRLAQPSAPFAVEPMIRHWEYEVDVEYPQAPTAKALHFGRAVVVAAFLGAGALKYRLSRRQAK